METFLQVVTTTASREEADAISLALVEARLAACVQVVGPIESRYRWDGGVEVAQEWLCLAKTTGSRYPQMEATIRELHSYDVPEIVAVPVVMGSEPYLRWVGQETATPV
ncbi:MAG: periplasmic divalent cation tolerance protein [Actinomycetota bacterium]|jgi:periplasmic divalent cation tolerance protein|nr:periplasmic divalent cation tolerance protein [Actinomycetota bacterium]